MFASSNLHTIMRQVVSSRTAVTPCSRRLPADVARTRSLNTWSHGTFSGKPPARLGCQRGFLGSSSHSRVSPRHKTVVSALSGKENSGDNSQPPLNNETDFLRAAVSNVLRSAQGLVILLKILDGSDRNLQVFVGEMEFASLAKVFHKQNTARPMTYDFMRNSLNAIGCEVTKVHVTEIKNNTFYARVYYVSRIGDLQTEVDVDARPSDAINLALRCQAPIYVHKDVAASSAFVLADSTSVKDHQPERTSKIDFKKIQKRAKRRRDPALELRARMAMAVALEHYEDAARFRDEIADIVGNDETARLLLLLEQAIADERFSDAVKIRDQLEELDNEATEAEE